MYDSISDIPTSNCSSYGTCIEGRCYCDDGYIGASDWINLEGKDCQITGEAKRGAKDSWALGWNEAQHLLTTPLPLVASQSLT